MRKRFLIKPRLQLGHLFWTLGVVLCSCVAGFFIFETILASSLSETTVSSAEWMAIRTALRTGFGVVLVILLGAIGIENYLLFHSIVGPLYALEKGLKRLAQGDFQDVTRIRQTDQLKDLILAFEEMKGQLHQRMLAQQKTNELLEKELENILKNASVENVAVIRQRLEEIRRSGDKKAA